jgi:NADH-quinone oxidoreductase subunit G
MSENRLTMSDVSLNPESSDLVKIKINGIEIQAPKNENIIESAKRVGIDIPYFCYHPRLGKGDAANCRMCLVEVATTAPDGSVRKMPKPQTACTLGITDGMVIETETAQVVRDRRGVLEFLLINHPLDCPICDRGGECPLQNNTIFYGPSTTRYIEEKRHFPKAYPLSDYVVFDRERCIHCARCTRFTEDISGDSQLGFLKRGADMEVGTFAHTAYKSKFSGNVIELCPVGALLSRTYRFKARPWDLNTQRSVCSRCSNGCNVKFDYRLDQLQRVNARLNEDVNEEWTCDRGKFGHDYVSSAARIMSPLLKDANGQFREIDWATALNLLIEKLKAADGSVGGIGGARLTNEDNFAFQRLFRQTLGSNNLDSRTGRYQGPTNAPVFDHFGFHGMGNSIADLEKMKSILVLGSDLVDEQPILFLRARKAWRWKGAMVVNAVTRFDSDTVRVGDFAAVEMVYRPGTEIALLNGLLNVMFAEKLLPVAGGFPGLQNSVTEWTPDRTAQETGVASGQISAAARALAKGPMAILAGKTVQEHPYYADIVAALGNLLLATGNPATNLNVPGLECNTQGAMDMGVLPDMGPGYVPVAKPGLNTHQMLEAAANGQLAMLWIAGADLMTKYHDPGLAQRALQNAFSVVSELSLTETALLADLVLPAASVAEKDGTYTNCERRVQRIYKAFDISPNIKADWLIFTETATRLAGGAPYFSARDILRDIAASVPLYQGITPRSLGENGVRWHYANSAAKPYTAAPIAYKAPAMRTTAGAGAY